MPRRVYELRNETDLKKHHFRLVRAIEVRPLPRGPFWMVAGRWVGSPRGRRHYIYLAPQTANGSTHDLLWTLAHEAGHNHMNCLVLEIGPSWKKDRRFQAVYRFKKQLERQPWLLLQFGLSPWIMRKDYSEFYCHVFTCAVGACGRNNQQRLKRYTQQNISEATLSEIIGVPLD